MLGLALPILGASDVLWLANCGTASMIRREEKSLWYTLPRNSQYDTISYMYVRVSRAVKTKRGDSIMELIEKLHEPI